MAVKLIRPSADLLPLVSLFRITETVLGDTEVRCPLPARASQFLEFFLGDPYQVIGLAGGPARTVPPNITVGPQTARTEDLVLRGSLRVFTIHFHPTGFHYLFGIPMHDLADEALSAVDVLGPRIVRLHQRLQETRDDQELIGLAETFLRASMRAPLHPDPVQRAAEAILRCHGRLDVASVARQVGLSPRQMERRFRVQVGVSPKILSRLTRFQRALHLRRALPEAGWARIAVDAGYYDQMHLAKEFQALAGESPSRLIHSMNTGASLLGWDA